jgi:hypothetical protein
MPLSRRGTVLLGLAIVVAAWLAITELTGVDTGLMDFVPAIAFCVPLLLARYPGERRLLALAARRGGHVPARTAPPALPRSRVPVMRRGGRLVASSLAKRPPPPLAPQLTA